MSSSLDKRLDIARKEEELARLEVRKIKLDDFKNYLNDNLRSTRKRRRGWTTPGDAERDMTSHDRQTAMAKARQKVEESPIVAGLMLNLADNQVGTGYRLIMNTKDKEFNKDTEARWDAKKDKLDVRGLRPWGHLQHCWWLRHGIDGDVGVNLMDGGTGIGGETLSYLQTIEGDRIFKNPMQSDDCGIDFDNFGRAKKYYVGRRKKTKAGAIDGRVRGKPIDAKHFVFYPHFPQERVERKRGVSMLLQNLNAFEDLEQIMDNMLQKVKNEAFIALNFEMEPAPDGSIFPEETVETKAAEDGKQRRHVKMVPGMNLNSEPGEKVSLLGTESPHSDWVPFIRFFLRYCGTLFGLPLEMLLMDFSDVNYSGGRALIELAKKRFRVRQARLAHVSSRCFQWWLSREHKYNGLTVPDSLKQTYWTHRWGVPGWPYLDPLKEAQAYSLLIDKGLTTRQQVLSETSDMDIDDVVMQLAEEIKLFNENNVPLITGLPGSNIINADKINEGDDD